MSSEHTNSAFAMSLRKHFSGIRTVFESLFPCIHVDSSYIQYLFTVCLCELSSKLSKHIIE